MSRRIASLITIGCLLALAIWLVAVAQSSATQPLQPAPVSTDVQPAAGESTVQRSDGGHVLQPASGEGLQ